VPVEEARRVGEVLEEREAHRLGQRREQLPQRTLDAPSRAEVERRRHAQATQPRVPLRRRAQLAGNVVGEEALEVLMQSERVVVEPDELAQPVAPLLAGEVRHAPARAPRERLGHRHRPRLQLAKRLLVHPPEVARPRLLDDEVVDLEVGMPGAVGSKEVEERVLHGQANWSCAAMPQHSL